MWCSNVVYWRSAKTEPCSVLLLFLIGVQLLAVVVMSLEFRRGIFSSGTVSIFWLIYAIYSTIPVYTYGMLRYHDQVSHTFRKHTQNYIHEHVACLTPQRPCTWIETLSDFQKIACVNKCVIKSSICTHAPWTGECINWARKECVKIGLNKWIAMSQH